MRLKIIVVVLSVLPQIAWAAEVETPHLEFVTEYVRELSAVENIRDAAKAEMKEKDSNIFANCIRMHTSLQLETAAQIEMMKGMHLNEQINWVPTDLVDFYQQLLDLFKQNTDICTAMMSAPKPGVDYGALSAKAPKVNAQIDYLEQTIFKVTPMVFATLIDQKPDADNHMSRLIITRAERGDLARTIKSDFGSKLGEQKQDWYVSSASVLLFYLTKKGYKCADEP